MKKNKGLNKKGQYDIPSLAPIAITFVIVAIVIGIGADVLDDVIAQQGYNGTLITSDASYSAGWAVNSTYNGLTSMETLSSWLPTLALVIVAAVVIGIIVTYFYMRRR